MFSFIKNKKIGFGKLAIFGLITFIILTVSLSSLFVLPSQTHAQPAQTGGPSFPQIPSEQNVEGGLDIWSLENSVSWIITTISLFILQYFSWGIAAAGFVLEAVIKMSVINISSFLNAPGVTATWATFRDIANMFFIFIILYIAIGTILGIGGIDIKRMLARVVIIALLLNFSMFFTKVAIDASNILTIGFYNQITNSQSCGQTIVGSVGGIGGAFACKLGVASLYSPEVAKTISESTKGGISQALKQLLLALVGSIFLSITAFVLLATAIMFLMRLVVFIFLVFLSPLAFVAMALPNDNYSSRWKHALVNNCIFAPVLMALFWAVLKIASALPSATGLGQAIVGTAAGAAPSNMGETLLGYGILIALIIASLLIAKEFGAAGAEGALSNLKSAQKWTQAKLGRAAVRGTGVAWVDKKFKDSNFGRSYVGSNLRKITTGAATSYEFGQKGGSVEKVDKERKKIQEEMAKDTNKDLEKKLDKSLPELRRERLATTKMALGQKETEVTKAEEDLNKLDTEVKKEEDQIKEARKNSIPIPAGAEDSLNQKKQRLDELKERAQDLKNERNKLKTLADTTDENIKKDSVATKDEKALWLTDLQKKKAESFSMTRGKRLEENAKKLQKIKVEAKTVRKEVSATEALIAANTAKIEEAKTKGWPEPTIIVQALKDNKAHLSVLQDKAKTLKNEYRTEKHSVDRITWTDIVNAIPSYATDRKKAADELKKLYRAGGSKDISSTLKDIIGDEGGGAKPDAGGGGAKT